MKTLAAKGRKLLSFAACVLAATALVAPTAEATRYLPHTLTPSTAPLAIPAASTAPEPALEHRSFDLFSGVYSENRASGDSGSEFSLNLLERQGVRAESHRAAQIIRSLGLYDHRARFYDPGTLSFLEPDPLGPIDSPNLYQAFGFDAFNVTDPYGLSLRWSDWVGILGDAYVSSMAPTQENTERAIGGVVGVGKFMADTAVAATVATYDGLPFVLITSSRARDRTVARAQGLGQMVAHPLDTVSGSVTGMAARVESHGAQGEHFSAGVVAGEYGTMVGTVVVGAAETGVAVTRMARASLSMDSITAGVSEGISEWAVGAEMELVPKFIDPPPVPPWKGPTDYSHLKDPVEVVKWTKPTPKQVSEMKAANRTQNNGLLRDDVTGEVMVDAAKSQRGVTPPSNEAQVDHKIPDSKGGTRSFLNLQLLTRLHNRLKWDRIPDPSE